MSDYLLGQLDDEVGLLTAENARLRAEVDKLTRWKAEATTVIEQWDAMWEAIGRPGPLGATKAECVRAEVETLRDALVTDKPMGGGSVGERRTAQGSSDDHRRLGGRRPSPQLPHALQAAATRHVAHSRAGYRQGGEAWPVTTGRTT